MALTEEHGHKKAIQLAAKQFFSRMADNRHKTPTSLTPEQLGNADYAIAIDDSGAIEPLLNKHGQAALAKPNDIALLFAFGLPKHSIEEFDGYWNDLREFIRRDLRLSKMPSIHARLMHGPNAPNKDGSKPNPYRGVSQAKRTLWLNTGYRIIEYFVCAKDSAFVQPFMQTRQGILDHFLTLMSRCSLWEDINYLSTKNNKRHLKLVAQRLSNPLTPMIAAHLTLLDLFLKCDGNKTAHIIFDPFDGSQGVTETSTLDILRTELEIDSIRSVERVTDYDNLPLAQAADILAFQSRRFWEKADSDRKKIDFSLLPPADATHPCARAANEEWDGTKFALDERERFILQYAIFFESIRELDGGLHRKLVDPTSFSQQVRHNQRFGNKVTILKERL